MKRTASRAIVLALSAALALGGAAAAKDHPDKGGPSGTHAATTSKAAKAVSLKVKGNAAHPGGTLHVLGVLHAAVGDRPPTMSAIVHFATGDVAVTLTRNGNGAAYHGNVPVPAGEPAGTVKIDGTAVVNGATITASGTGKIVVETSETSETTTTTSATATETSTTCTATTTTTSAKTTTETTTTTTTSESSESSESSDSSESDESSDASETETSKSRDASESDKSDSCDNESHGTSSLTPAMLASIVSFLESFLH